MRPGHRTRQLLAALLALLALTAAAPAAALELSLPLACEPGDDCVVQHYVDLDPGPGAADHACGSQTYDTHNGTDFRLPSLAAMRAGVDVLAAAAGSVARVRDGVADRMYEEARDAETDGRECGNGVVIEHADGWTSQYCHLAQGSLSVSPGDTVEAGARLGAVGLSGQTQFPHLHFVVRRGDSVVDPFRPEPGAAMCAPGRPQATLWRGGDAPDLAYRPAFVLNTGFAEGPITMQDVEGGTLEGQSIAASAPALVFFGRAIGIREGDRQRLELVAPDGRVLARNETEPADRVKAQVFAFAGKKSSGAAWPRGVYRGVYSIVRDGAEVARGEARVIID